MPTKPARPCRYPRCKELTRSFDGYCPEHRSKRQKEYNENNRNQEQNAYYQSKEWRKLRAMQLQLYPNCRVCGKFATVADHIKPRDKGGKDELDNLQSLCKECHSTKTAKQGGRYDGAYGRKKQLQNGIYNHRYRRFI